MRCDTGGCMNRARLRLIGRDSVFCRRCAEELSALLEGAAFQLVDADR